MSQPTLTAPCSSVSPLRQRMLDDMRLRGLRQETQRDYIRCVRSFAAFLEPSPDSATTADIRRFQAPHADTGVQPPTVNGSVSALRFLFTVTLDRPDLSRRFVLVRQPRKLPDVLSVAEVGRLLEATPHNRLTRRATRAGGRPRLPRCRAGLPAGPGRAPEPAPAQGDGGHRAVPHRLPRWSCRGLRRLRPHAHRLQLLPTPALPKTRTG